MRRHRNDGAEGQFPPTRLHEIAASGVAVITNIIMAYPIVQFATAAIKMGCPSNSKHRAAAACHIRGRR